MRHDPIDPALFIEHRQQIAAKLPPNSIAIVHAADPLTTNGDGAVRYVPAATTGSSMSAPMACTRCDLPIPVGP